METFGRYIARVRYENTLRNMEPIVDVPMIASKDDIGEFTVKIIGDTPLIVNRWGIQDRWNIRYLSAR